MLMVKCEEIFTNPHSHTAGWLGYLAARASWTPILACLVVFELESNLMNFQIKNIFNRKTELSQQTSLLLFIQKAFFWQGNEARGFGWSGMISKSRTVSSTTRGGLVEDECL